MSRAGGISFALTAIALVAALAGTADFTLRADPCRVDRSSSPYREPTPPPTPAAGETPLPLYIPPAETTITSAAVEPLVKPDSWRFGVGVPGGLRDADWVPRVGAGWWLGWNVLPAELLTDRDEHWQMIRLGQGKTHPAARQVAQAAAQAPGQTWIVGNEPDVVAQDNTTPGCYAALYHDVYLTLKRADPSARVAVGGVAQATPLRLAYLDLVLRGYQEQFGEVMPVDVWTVHGYVLPEQRHFWGVGIPPGIANDYGELRGPTVHDDMRIFRSQIGAFRHWMAQRGYRDRPLALTEFGIVLSVDNGFADERVVLFMQSAFDYLYAARDSDIGYPDDDNRLVQRWAWFSMAYPPFPRSNLIDPASGTLTVLGAAYREYVAALPREAADD